MKERQTEDKKKIYSDSEGELESVSKSLTSETNEECVSKDNSYRESSGSQDEGMCRNSMDSDKDEIDMQSQDDLNNELLEDVSNDSGRERSIELTDKEDFFYSDDKLEIDADAIDDALVGYDDAQEDNLSETKEDDDITESKEMHIYYDKEESRTSEEDIIEGREETTLPIASEKEGKRKGEPEEPRKAQKEEYTPELREEKILEYIESIEKKIELREKGWKPNNKPLIWKYTVESYQDESEPINDEAVIERFRSHMEKPYIKYHKKLNTDQYYNSIQKKKKKPATPAELKELKERMENNRIVEIQKILRKRTKEEKEMLNKTRNLHVKLKEIGYQTEASDIFALLTQEYILQKKDMVSFMENAINTLSYIQNRKEDGAQYLSKCIEFIEQNVTVE